MTIEKATADTILQNKIGSVIIDGEEYKIDSPTTGTLIMASGFISELPEIQIEDKDGKDFIAKTLGAAKECDALGKIAATLILGAKRIKEHPICMRLSYQYEKKWSWLKFRRIEVPVETRVPVFERDYLAEKIIDNSTPKELQDLINGILSESNLASFFVLTTSLKEEKNILAPTREVEKPTTTASGPSSEAGPNIGR